MGRLRLIAFCLFAGPAAAFDGGGIVEVSVMEGWRSDEGVHIAALHMRLEPGWKTYWRVPGEGGIPPRFDWSGSGNLAAAEPRFPIPGVFDISGFKTIGYENEVVFPLLLRPERADSPIALEGRMEFGVCSDICVPVALEVSSLLPPDGGLTDSLIRRALDDQPKMAGTGSATCLVRPVDGGMSVTANIRMPDHGHGETVVMEHPDPEIWVTGATLKRSGDTVTAVAEFLSSDGKPFPMARDAIRITMIGSRGATEIAGCPAG